MPSLTAQLACAFTAGVGTGVATQLPSVPLPTAFLILITVASLALTCRLPSGYRRVAAVCLVIMAGAQHGARAREMALQPPLRLVLDETFGGFAIGAAGTEGRHDPVRLRAVLVEDAAVRDDFVSLRLQARAILIANRWRPVYGGLSLSVNGAASREPVAAVWRAGRTIEAPVTFRRPARYLNEGVADFERDAALDGLAVFASVKSGLLVEVVAPGSRLAEAAAVARRHARDAVSRWVLPYGDVPAAIVIALLIGDRTGLPDDVRTRLQAAGTYHVIAISGGNIAILAALVIGTFITLRVHWRFAAFATIAVLVAYAGIVSAGPSVWRATLMAVLYFSARVLDHRTPPWHVLALTTGVVAAVQPLDVRDAGFLLTFGATAGLLAVGRTATTWLPTPRIAGWMVASVVASMAAELVLLPVSAAVFSRVTAAGLLLNLIAIPLMAIVQVAGMIVVFLDSIQSIAAPAGWFAAQGAVALVGSARFVDYAPALVHRVPPPPSWIIAAYYIALLVAWRGRSLHRPVAAVVLATAATLIITGTDPLSSPPRGDVLRLTMMDVGQGESMLLQIPGAEAIVIDAAGSPFGGNFDVGTRVLAPALWARHVRRLGSVLVTHGDPDHLGGGQAVLSDFSPDTVWWGTPVPPHQPSREFLAAAEREGSAVAFRRAGDELRAGDTRIRVLHPPPPDWERQKVRNDDSLVVEILHADVALLLTGDIGADIERRIAPSLTPARVRVLKVAHHGSRSSSSSDLLEHWRPQIALISSGRGNTFGHPAREVLERLDAIGARVYRTDRDGQITLESDGTRVGVRTFNGEQK